MDYKVIKEKDVGIIRTDGMMEEGLTVVEGRMDGWWDKRKDGGMER